MANPIERPAHPLYVGYTLALVTCGVAGLVQYALMPVLGDRFPLGVFSAAVAVAAWTGGSGPGLLATLCAALVGVYFFFEPRYTFSVHRPDDYLALTLFILTGVVISLSIRRLRRQALSDRDARAEAERLLVEAEGSRTRADLELRERQKAEELLRQSEAKYRGLAVRTNKLYELSAGLSEAVTVNAVARVIAHQGKTVVGASAASVAVLADAGQTFETICAEGYPRSVAETWQRYPATGGLLSFEAVRRRQPVFVSSFNELQRLYPESAAPAADGGFASAAALPLLIENAVMGVLAFHFTAPVHFDPGYSALLLSVAQHCAQALERARLYESAQAARRAAEEANRAKDEFLSTVSHELRTPLNAMLGWASLLKNGTLDGARHTRAIEAIYTNATRQAHLIEELLDVSRIVAGRAPIDRQTIDIGDNVRGAVEAILPLAEAKGLDVRVGASPSVAVHGDPRRLEQVFLNVLSNAVKFTPGGGRIAVDTSVSGDHVEVRVTDTGTGIEPSFLPDVFERFRQADSTMARSVGGLGLGLFIARRLIEAQGGRISAHSDGTGRGATFTVSLPVAAMSPMAIVPFVAGLPPVADPRVPDDADAGAPAPPVLASRHDSPIAAPSLAGIHVLAVDDDTDAREVMASALESAGARVTAVSSASDALQWLSRDRFDILLTDIAMPEQDGYALLRAIRRQVGVSYADIPAAAVTASAGDEERVRVLGAGFQAHITKPVRPETLASTVARLACVVRR